MYFIHSPIIESYVAIIHADFSKRAKGIKGFSI